MEGYYVARTLTCQACAARDVETADKQGHGVMVAVIDESYTEGYEPRSAVAVDQAPRQQGDADQAEQHGDQ